MSFAARPSFRSHGRGFILGGVLLLTGGCSGPGSADGDTVASESPEADAGTSDGATKEGGAATTCGYLNHACCNDGSCSVGLICDSGQCVRKGTGQLGTTCTKPSQCESGLCLPISNDRAVCTARCTAGIECLAGWSCGVLEGERSLACQCEPKAEACNAEDDDCNGLIDDASFCKQGCDDPDECALATGLSLTEVVAYQAVGVPLMLEGEKIFERSAPLVIGKDAMIRVHVRPEAAFQAREVVAWLEIDSGSGKVTAHSSKLFVQGASEQQSLETTFNVEVPGAQITPNSAFKISLREASPYAKSYPGETSSATWPETGAMRLEPEDSRGNIEVTIVPYRYNGRLPDTTEQQLRLFREKFTSYPTPDIDIIVHAPVDHEGSFNARGTGWNQLLNKTCNLRQNERPTRNRYYFGLIAPADDVSDFCEAGCVAGLAYLGEDPSDNYTRCGIGLGFTGAMSAETMLHEIGHALGRMHAPCGGPDGVDRHFPYSDGTIGVRGYERPRKRLHEPSVRDFMGYCSPMWISDYTYSALFDRIAYVNAAPRILPPPGFPERWRAIVIEADSSLHVGATMKLDAPPSGTPTTVYLLDASGKLVGTATGFRYETSHLPGGSLLVPEEELAGASAIRLAGGQAVSL